MQSHAPVRYRFLFLKAIIRDGRAADLFAEQVDVQGYSNKRGTWVQPHRATRHKRHRAITPHEERQTDLFTRPTSEIIPDERPEPPPPPPAPPPEPAAKPKRARSFDRAVQLVAMEGKPFTVEDLLARWQGGKVEDALDLLHAHARDFALLPDGRWQPMADYLKGDPEEALRQAREALAGDNLSEYTRARLKEQVRRLTDAALERKPKAEEKKPEPPAPPPKPAKPKPPPKPRTKKPAITPDKQPVTVRTAPGVEKALPGMNAMMKELLARFCPGADVTIIEKTDQGSAGNKASGGGGWMRYEGGGTKYTIAMNVTNGAPKAKQMRVLFHEVGHFITWHRLAEADQETRDAVVRQWAEETRGKDAKHIRLYTSVVNLIGKVDGSGSAKDKLRARMAVAGVDWAKWEASDKGQYWGAFNEWVAEKGAHWLTTDEKPRTVVDAFFADVARAMQAAYRAAARLFGVEYQDGALQKLLRDTWDTPSNIKLSESMRHWYAYEGLTTPGSNVDSRAQIFAAKEGKTIPEKPVVPPASNPMAKGFLFLRAPAAPS